MWSTPNARSIGATLLLAAACTDPRAAHRPALPDGEGGAGGSGGGAPRVDPCNGIDDDGNGVIDDGGANTCGGSCTLQGDPGSPCAPAGACRVYEWACVGPNAVSCEEKVPGQIRWVWHAEGDGRPYLSAVAPTRDGGALILGQLVDRLDLGGGITVEEASKSGRANFLARLDATGHAQWARLIQGLEQPRMTVAANGDVFVVGLLGATVPAADATVFVGGGETTLGLAEGPGFYAARIDAAGEPLALARVTDRYPVTPGGYLAATSDGGLAVLLEARPARLGLVSGALAGSFVVRRTDKVGAYLLVFDANLEPRWIRQLELEEGGARDLVADGQGALYVTGSVRSGPARFSVGESDAAAVDTGSGVSYVRAALARYSEAGDLQWISVVAGGTGFSVSVEDGGVFLAGATQRTGDGAGEAVFGPDLRLQDASPYLARYRSDGTLDWFDGVVGGRTTGRIAAAPGAGVYLVALVSGDVSLGVDDPAPLSLAAESAFDVMVARFDENGYAAWAQLGSGGGYPDIPGIAVASDGDLLLAGTTADHLYFGRCGEQADVHPDGAGSLFVVKIAP